jgi:aryl-alcohol dehydrogenase-like predicted oxidoreductase
METLRSAGRVERIGASVYTASQIDALLDKFSPTLVQLPVSIVDQRLVQSGHLAKLKRRGVEVHARSVLLQGLLLVSPSEREPYFRQFEREFSNLDSLLVRLGLTPLEAALAFIRELEEIDVAIVGAISREQLKADLEAFHRPRADRLDFSAVACRSESLLNPSLWPTSR